MKSFEDQNKSLKLATKNVCLKTGTVLLLLFWKPLNTTEHSIHCVT